MVVLVYSWHTNIMAPLTTTPNAVLTIHHILNLLTNYIGVVVFGIMVMVWIVFTIIGVYHWLRYAHRSFMMIPILATHFFISLSLIAYAWSGLV